MEQTPDDQPLPGIEIPIGDQELSKMPRWASPEARKEEREWDDLEKIKRENDGKWLTTYGQITVLITWAFAIVFGASLFVWSWHYIGPADAWNIRFHWLNEEQLDKIQSILFSSSMGAVVSGVVKSQLSKAQS